MRPIIDAHLDLAWNALSFNRDLTLEVAEVCQRESHMTDVRCRGRATTTLPELRRGGIRLCIATLLARSGPEHKVRESYLRCDLDYATQSIAFAAAHGQLAYYRLLEQQGEIRFINTRGDLDGYWRSSKIGEPNGEVSDAPLGIILSMEGGDPILTPEQLQQWWDWGLRALGPAHYGRSHYAYGTGVSGPLSDAGRSLLKQMSRLGMLLDVTHLCDQSMFEALELFDGPMLASHHNCRALVPHERQITDEQIRLLIERDAVIGAALDAWMLHPQWKKGESSPDELSLEAVADHTDHICQIAGNTKHAAIGSDLDGGFGTEQTPGDLKTIADLQKLDDILTSRGYSDKDIDAIFHGNWLRLFERALPE